MSDPIEATATAAPAEPPALEHEPPEPDAPMIDAALIPARPGAVGSALADMPVIPTENEMNSIAQLAVTLAAAGACPAAIRGKPNDVFLVLLSARDLGVSLTTAMREFHVIEGKVTLSPKVKLALVRQSGLGKIWPDGGNSALTATWHAERHDLPGHVVSQTFTWDDAQLAHLVDSRCTPYKHWKKEGQASGRNSADCLCKTNWKTYPQRMLSWRSAGYLLDDVFPEVGTGLYSPDELGAVTDADGEPIEVRAVESLPGLKGGGQRPGAAAAEAPRISAEKILELRARVGRAKGHEAAKADLGAWWREREMPKVSDMTEAQARIMEAKLAQLENVHGLKDQPLPTPEPDGAGAAAEPPQEPAPPSAPAEPAPEAPGGPEAPIQPAPQDEGDGDVAGWLIGQASGMTAEEIAAAYEEAGEEPPKGNLALLRRAWAMRQFAAMGRNCTALLSAALGRLIDPAGLEASGE